MPSRLEDELSRLVSAGVLRAYQADALRAAAAADAEEEQELPRTAAARPGQDRFGRQGKRGWGKGGDEAGWREGGGRADAGRGDGADERADAGGDGRAGDAGAGLKGQRGARRASALLEVLGYIGGALLLGAIALLMVANWGEMGRAARISTAAGAAVVLLGAAVVLTLLRRSGRVVDEGDGWQQLSAALAALGCCVAGFAMSVAIEGATGRIAGVVVALLLAGLGLFWLAGASLLVATFLILSVGVLVLTGDVFGADPGPHPNSAGIAATGFILVAVALAGLGLLPRLDQVTAWSLAGAAMFSSSICWLVQDRGEVMALAVGTAGPAALLVAYGRRRASAYAVVGCSILLVIWPTALYQLTENLVGVAVGLVIASAVLLVAVLLLSRRGLSRSA